MILTNITRSFPFKLLLLKYYLRFIFSTGPIFNHFLCVKVYPTFSTPAWSLPHRAHGEFWCLFHLALETPLTLSETKSFPFPSSPEGVRLPMCWDHCLKCWAKLCHGFLELSLLLSVCCLTSSVINLVGQGLWFIFFAQCVKATDCKWDNCFFTVVQNLNVWGRTKPCWSIPLKSLFPRTLGGTPQVNKL